MKLHQLARFNPRAWPTLDEVAEVCLVYLKNSERIEQQVDAEDFSRFLSLVKKEKVLALSIKL